jgi:hypothetical protein
MQVGIFKVRFAAGEEPEKVQLGALKAVENWVQRQQATGLFEPKHVPLAAIPDPKSGDVVISGWSVRVCSTGQQTSAETLWLALLALKTDYLPLVDGLSERTQFFVHMEFVEAGEVRPGQS